MVDLGYANEYFRAGDTSRETQGEDTWDWGTKATTKRMPTSPRGHAKVPTVKAIKARCETIEKATRILGSEEEASSADVDVGDDDVAYDEKECLDGGDDLGINEPKATTGEQKHAGDDYQVNDV